MLNRKSSNLSKNKVFKKWQKEYIENNFANFVLNKSIDYYVYQVCRLFANNNHAIG